MEPAATTTGVLQTTPLHALHLARGAKMVAFAGYDMPVQYADAGVLKEHLFTRSSAGLFDVSHMGQAFLTGVEDPASLLEKIVPGDIAGLAPGKTRYTVLLNDKGGIVDDLMVTRLDAKTLFLVVNAACKDKDFALIRKAAGAAAKLEILADRALIALQGPETEEVLSVFYPDVRDMAFMTFRAFDTVFITRSGYTGEDGFEISVPAARAVDFVDSLLKDGRVKPAGLGARDSLRLEAGLCLYGHDLDEVTTPVEANLKWTIGKKRRERGDFAGARVILEQLEKGPPRLRVGLRPQDRAPVREGTELLSPDGKRIGIVTSGGFGPTLDAPVAMGYVETDFAGTGTALTAMVRGTARPCVVADLPFIPARYKKG
jgi:aminomethyltransferase